MFAYFLIAHPWNQADGILFREEHNCPNTLEDITARVKEINDTRHDVAYVEVHIALPFDRLSPTERNVRVNQFNNAR